MRRHSVHSTYVTSSSSSETSTDESDSDTDSSDADAAPTKIDPYLTHLIKVAQKLAKKPEDNETFTKFVATLPIRPGKAAKRRAKETLADLAKKRRREPKRLWLCSECNKSFEAKDDIKKHQETCKKTEVVKETRNANKVFACDKCDKSYAYKANLKRHEETKHVNLKNKTKCELCKDEKVVIYKHYITKHGIENVQQLLFDKGGVFVDSDISTENGKAPWFLKQLEKAKYRYKGAICRLCEADLGNADLLKAHYTGDHKVDADFLNVIQYIFRSEMGAHLGETSNMKRADRKGNVTDKKKEEIKRKPQNRDNTRIIYRCLKCDNTTDTYDAAVEHSQEHLVAKHTGEEMGITRNFAFETNIDDNTVIDYNFETLLTEAWFQMFNDITCGKDSILSSSVYIYSRSVKLHSEGADSTTGIPAYKCDMCQLFVDPAKLENHCKNFDTCVKNKPNGHSCKSCGARFYSANALAYHSENHAKGFRFVTFNRKNDAPINKILGKLQNLSDDSQEEEELEENPKGHADGKRVQIKDVEQYCKQCKKWIASSIIEAHNAEHHKEKETNSGISSESGKDANDSENVDVGNQSESATGEETEQQPQDNHVNDRMHTEDEDPTNGVNIKETGITSEISNVSNDTESVAVNESATRETELPQDNRIVIMQAEDEDITMDDVHGKETDPEGTVEPWDSDDSCQDLHSISVQAEIYMSFKENITVVQNARALEVIDADSQPIMSGNEELKCTEELEEMFKSDSENNLEEQGNTTNNDELPSTQELQQMLENDDDGNENLEQNRQEAARDISGGGTTQDENGEANMGENTEPQDITAQDVEEQDRQEAARDISGGGTTQDENGEANIGENTEPQDITAQDVEEQDRQEAARDISGGGTTQDENGEANMGETNEPQDFTAQESVGDDKTKTMSARDIINEIISDDIVEFDSEEFSELYANVKMKLWSRD